MNSYEKSKIIGATTEYSAMRDEILTRLRIRHQVVALTLAVSGVLLGVGINNPAVALVYPPLAALLALAWGQNDYRIRNIARYIRDKINPVVPGVGWETHIEDRRRDGRVRSGRYVVASHGGLFLVTQLMATLLGSAWALTAPSQDLLPKALVWILIILDVLAIGVVLCVVWKASRAAAG